MNRISIVGISGSGKSTLANNLGKKLNLPVFHLDKYYWDVGWKERYATKEEFNNVARVFAEQDKWIIDGNYRGTLDFRLERADVIIFLDFPKWRCIWRVVKRAFDRKQPFDKTEGVKEKVDWFLIKWILNYPTDVMRERVLKYVDKKRVYILKNNRDISDLLSSLGN
jgi:adenylate kinase family enzyme